MRIYIEGQSFNLRKSQLIQSGGEGMVFELNALAVKLYHRPKPFHRAKLQRWLESGIGARLPDHILGPDALAKNSQNEVIGFRMCRLPKRAQPAKILSNSLARQKQRITASAVVQIFLQVHETLELLHQQQVVVGDLNDHNIFFEPIILPKNDQGYNHPVHWIDVDSYQFEGFPCPVATQSFLDPTLYGVADLSQKPMFTPLSDWYAFLTLFIKSLLLVHPYGGTHQKHKSLTSRASSGISILHPGVIYPKQARPLATLSDELLHAVHLVFDEGRRMKIPRNLLSRYASTLVDCSTCGISFPSNRRRCPSCRNLGKGSSGKRAATSPGKRILIEEDGYIEHVSVQPNGRILAIVRSGRGFKLVRAGAGGKLDEMWLFDGRANYRFGLFMQPGEGQFLVASPVGDSRLLLLDVSDARPRQISLLETATYRDDAVFATTSSSLFRVAGQWIMQGRFRDGHYVEDPLATAHRNQTYFDASGQFDIAAGYHRVFAEQFYFLIRPDSSAYAVAIPPIGPGESVRTTAVAFGPGSVAFMQEINSRGRTRVDTHIADLSGKLLQSLSESPDAASHFRYRSYPYTFNTAHPTPPFIRIPRAARISESIRLHTHPKGLLVQGRNHIDLTTNQPGY